MKSLALASAAFFIKKVGPSFFLGPHWFLILSRWMYLVKEFSTSIALVVVSMPLTILIVMKVYIDSATVGVFEGAEVGPRLLLPPLLARFGLCGSLGRGRRGFGCGHFYTEVIIQVSIVIAVNKGTRCLCIILRGSRFS